MTEQILYNEQTISDAVHTKWAGKTVHFARETDSTNEWLKRIKNESHGTLAVTEYQNAGKGRLGRKWETPMGSSVMMSLLLHPDFAPQYASMLTLVMGLSIAQAVQELGISVAIKWPNDVVVSHKKICGILTEMGLEGDKIAYVIIGSGINVNVDGFPEGLADKATSLYLETGQEYDRNRIIGLVMKYFESNYEKFCASCDLSLLKEAYESLLANKDQSVRVLGTTSYEGVCLGIEKNGELLVKRGDTGEICRVNAGEVSVRGLYSYV